eukprot:scaffold2295_cov93-Skeletonema_dohrnii-CCMP3373.AAC.7
MKRMTRPKVHRPINTVTLDVGKPPSSRGETWKTFTILYHSFEQLSTGSDHHGIMSPNFSCNGKWWNITIFPCGGGEAPDENVSIYLYHVSEGSASATFSVGILDMNGVVTSESDRNEHFFVVEDGVSFGAGVDNFVKRSDILDPLKNILDSNGTLRVKVQMKEEPKTAFVPHNPFLKMMQSIFLDETSADVCFEVSVPAEEEGSDTAASDDLFHAHRLILDTCAPMLAALCGSSENGEMATATITDVSPKIFRQLLFYVYGGSVPKDDLKAHAKAIIDASNKYSIVNLKLEAEEAYVDSTEITIDNVMDNLLYADAMNLALLKEVAVNFLADNGEELLTGVSFNDLPGHVVKDMLVATTRKKKKAVPETAYDYETCTYCAHGLSLMSVNDLRRMMYEMDYDADGSREAMIEALSKGAPKESISDDED